MNNNEDRIVRERNDGIRVDQDGTVVNETVQIKESKTNNNGGRIVYYILGLLEVLLAFRLVFKLLGANPGSGFVAFIYSITEIFLVPFNAIFSSASTEGIETQALLEPATIIGMIVYAIIGWGIVKMLTIFRERNENHI